MTVAFIILGLFLFALTLKSHRGAAASSRPDAPDHERDLRNLKNSYAAGEITLEQFEAQVKDVLEAEPPVRATGTKPPIDPQPPVGYAERWEIHIHDAPTNHELHIHL